MTLSPSIYDEEAGFVHSELNFWFVFKRRNLPVTLPKLHIMPVNKLLCLFRGLDIIGAFEWNRVEEMAI
jgi:hypothetical protein